MSSDPFSSLNVGDHVQDDPCCVAENRRRIMQAFMPEPMHTSKLICPVQVHGKHVEVCVGKDDIERTLSVCRGGADGVVACGLEIPVLLCFADCVPVIMVAPTRDIAVVHAGWRGVVNEICAEALMKLTASAHCEPSECNIYIGPFIHANHFEIAGEALDAFHNVFGSSCFVDERHVDMACALRMTFDRMGVDPKRVCDLDMCTVDNQDLFYSYRGAKGICGRHAAFAVSLQQEVNDEFRTTL